MNRLLYLLLFTSATWQLQAQVSAFFKVDSTQACQTLNVIVTNQAISNPTPVDSIVINFGDGHIDTIVSPAYDSQYPHFYSEPGNYTILFTAYKNGVYNTKQQVINVYALPNSTFTAGTYPYYSLQDTFYIAANRYLFAAALHTDTLHTWMVNGQVLSYYGDSSVYLFPTTDNYLVSHSVSEHSCISTSQISITITDTEIKIPNVFTPNSDGQNDLFYVKTDGVQTYTFTVVNRYGARIFVLENARTVSWDGYTYWGEPAEVGNYYFIFKSQQGETITGSLFLNR